VDATSARTIATWPPTKRSSTDGEARGESLAAADEVVPARRKVVAQINTHTSVTTKHVSSRGTS
jgi:hypothetical protein